jgi:phosphonate transport system permease protein
MAVIGILVAALLSIPIGLLAARNVSNVYVYYAVRTFLSFIRCIPELVWAIIFVVITGLGPWAGTLAIIFGTTGSFGKLFAESIESIDPRPVDALRATGANAAAVSVFSVIPQAFPLLLSYVLYYWESTVRHATVLGLVGAGGIGVRIQADTGALRYDRLIVDIICIFVAVLIIDRISALLRARLL